ncbi:MAG TPA: hypothetical protein VMG34_11410 [Bacteroidota bacterium]|nr:hypothetical protein [Bacteroidota bacterium]
MDQDDSFSLTEEVPEAKPAPQLFTKGQYLTIQDLGDRMKTIGLLYYLVAGFMGVGGVVSLFSSFPTAFVCIAVAAFFGIMGRWTQSGAVSFHVVVRARGSEFQQLMYAIEDLHKIYEITYWSAMALLGLTALGVILMIVTELV